jgi:hypothetical protein
MNPFFFAFFCLLFAHSSHQNKTLTNKIGADLPAGKKTLTPRGLEEHVRINLIFSRIISFMLFTVLLSPEGM